MLILSILSGISNEKKTERWEGKRVFKSSSCSPRQYNSGKKRLVEDRLALRKEAKRGLDVHQQIVIS